MFLLRVARNSGHGKERDIKYGYPINELGSRIKIILQQDVLLNNSTLNVRKLKCNEHAFSSSERVFSKVYNVSLDAFKDSFLSVRALKLFSLSILTI